jgi:hypothetical protein
MVSLWDWIRSEKRSGSICDVHHNQGFTGILILDFGDGNGALGDVDFLVFGPAWAGDLHRAAPPVPHTRKYDFGLRSWG